MTTQEKYHTQAAELYRDKVNIREVKQLQCAYWAYIWATSYRQRQKVVHGHPHRRSDLQNRLQQADKVAVLALWITNNARVFQLHNVQIPPSPCRADLAATLTTTTTTVVLHLVAMETMKEWVKKCATNSTLLSWAMQTRVDQSKLLMGWVGLSIDDFIDICPQIKEANSRVLAILNVSKKKKNLISLHHLTSRTI